MDAENGQTTIEYLLVLSIVVFVIFFALRSSALDEAIKVGVGKVANRILELVAP